MALHLRVEATSPLRSLEDLDALIDDLRSQEYDLRAQERGCPPTKPEIRLPKKLWRWRS